MKGSSIHTVENYGFHLDKFANFLEQNKLMFDNLTAKQDKLFRNYLVDQGLQSRTVNSILAAVKTGISDYSPGRPLEESRLLRS